MNSPTDFEPEPVTHENTIMGRMIAHQLSRTSRYVLKTREQLLRCHYLHGAPHPDDCNLPIDKWDETQ